ncbi:MAG: LacI family DNA-binding transcriptional regulator [Verrucomicrobiota bacterium]|nr:LacI family DNA-binding transcriptional regulator [Verrucomicrobiota bacterium]
MPAKRVTLADIASHLGVNKSTVSRALQNDPSVNPGTVDKVRAMAAALGYVPDPALSALSQERWRREDRQCSLNWAYLCEQPDSVNKREELVLLGSLAGKLGYSITPVGLRQQGGARTINRILRARGVCGVLLDRVYDTALAHRFDWDHLDWPAYSWVAAIESRYAPAVHRVINNSFDTTREAFARMVNHGYKRIGFIQEAPDLSRENERQQAAFLQYKEMHPTISMVQAFVGERIASMATADIDRLRSARPTAILYGYTAIRDRLPHDLAALPWATLTSQADDKSVAGIHMSMEAMFRAAVDLLDFQYRRRERGLPQHRHTLLVDAIWQDGESLPRLG